MICRPPFYRPQSPARPRGISLIEVVVVMAIVAVMATFLLPGVGTLLERRALEGVAAELATDLRYVRSEAVARNTRVRIGFESGHGSSCYVVHTGTAGACHCMNSLAGAAALCDMGASAIKTVRLAATGPVQVESNVASMLFDPFEGTTTPAATVSVIGRRGEIVEHVVSIMGRVRTCSKPADPKTPGGQPLFGYRPC